MKTFKQFVLAEEQSGSFTVKHPQGLHAGPAVELTKVTKGFKSDIKINGVDGKSIIKMMGLRLPHGAAVKVTASGEDDVAALAALKKYFG